MSETGKGAPLELPVICMDTSLMVFPGVSTHFDGQSQEIISGFMDKFGITPERPWVMLAMVNPKIEDFTDKTYKTGVVSEVKIDQVKGDIIFTGLYRAEITGFKGVFSNDNKGGDDNDPLYYLATIRHLHDENCDEYFLSSEAAIRGAFLVIKEIFLLYFKEIHEIRDITNLAINVSAIKKLDYRDKDAVDQIIWAILYHMPDDVGSSERQVFLESDSLIERIELLSKLLDRHLRIALFAKEHLRSLSRKSRDKLLTKGSGKPQPGTDESDQVELVDKEIANSPPEIVERWEKYKKIKDTIGSDPQKAILEDFARLKSSASGQAEWNTFTNHLDCLLDIYSAVNTPQEKDVSKVEKTLDESHYDMEGVKEEIYNHLAVKNLNPNGKAPILCFVGAPGVGKTSIGKSIAEALALKFTRLSFGGVKDEADVRGHRLTYIGAIPGKIIQEIRRIGVKNPVFMLDEVDKISNDFRGDPSSALLEVLDPEQNHSFQDHYVGAPYDLSGVLFLCTANTASGIQPALLDRMNVINVSGYTELQKIQIAKKFLIPKQFTEVGLANKGVRPCWPDNNPDKVISKIISGYTREAGVRELERQIHKMLSVWARQYLKENDDKKPSEILITEEMVEKFLGLPKQTHERVNVTEVGEAIGLAWTPVGGDIMYIQAQLTPHGRTEKDISQTGGLLEVFIEANKNALTVVKNLLKNDDKAMKKLMDNLLHLSVPDGAIKKDGPSAGITMAMAIYSELVGKPLKPYLAMSGEITIKGRIRAVGGLKEKILAAHRDGVKEVVLPATNKRDVEKDIPDEINRDIKFHYVTHINEVLPIVFPEKPPI